jgi:hypothetical protein
MSLKTNKNKKSMYKYKFIKKYIESCSSSKIDEILKKKIKIIDNPVFIVGCGHSGTSLLNKLIGNHSNIYSIKEESGIFYIDLDKNIKNDIFKLWSYIAISKNKKRWVEKTPIHVHHINEIFNTFPKAKVIIITRHGKAVCSSLKKRYNSFTKSIKRWLNDNIAWIKNENLSKCLVIKYENIIKDRINTFKIICDYIDEPYEDLSNTNENTEVITKLPFNHIENRNYQINQLIYDNINESMNEFTEDDQFIFDNYYLDDFNSKIVLEILNYC